MDQNRKTWDLVQRARKVSRGQTKIFLTRNAADEQQLAKLTHNLEKEKCAKQTELILAKKLLLKRYGGAKHAEGEHQTRDRSLTWDSTFMTKVSEGCLDMKQSSEISRAHSLGNVSGNETTRQKESRAKDVLINDRLQTVSLSDGHIDILGIHTARPKDNMYEQRPRAVSEILPPITLPPLYKGQGLFPKDRTHRPRDNKTHQTRKTSLKGETTGRKITENKKRIEVSIQMDDSLSYCRYLRNIERESK